MTLLKTLLILFSILSLTSCVQTPARVIYGSSSNQPSNSNYSETRINPYKVVIKPGDNLYSVSKKYSVSIETLIRKNRLQPPYILSAGESLVLPTATFHTVKKGDTLYLISQNYNININNIIKSNNLKKPYIIKIGDRLKLPINFYDIQAPVQITSNEIKKEREIEVVKPVKLTKPVTLKIEPKNIDFNAPIPILKSNYKNKKPLKNKNNYLSFEQPLNGKIISNFGAKKGGLYNDGINISAKSGTTIRASESGQVVYSGNELRGYGNLILLKHDKGYITAYAHNQQNLIKKGEYVNKGQAIAYVGQTGHVSSPQLHFSLRKGRKPYDPQKYFKKRL